MDLNFIKLTKNKSVVKFLRQLINKVEICKNIYQAETKK